MELGGYVDFTDDLTARTILEMLEVKPGSLWFSDDATTNDDAVIDMIINEKRELTFEQVKELYPAWFNE